MEPYASPTDQGGATMPEPTYEFPLISEDEDATQAEELTDEAAWVLPDVKQEMLYEDTGGDWKSGDRGNVIGTVTLSHTRTKRQQRVIVHAFFVFDNGETVEYAGLVPGEGKWQGKGRLGYRGGTGKFADRGGELDVEATNPKHWG
jgi:hypothetical protein